MKEQEVKRKALRGYIDIQRRIDTLQAEKRMWMRRIVSICGANDGMPRGGDSTSKPERISLRIADIEAQIDDDLLACKEARERVRKLIDSVSEEKYRSVLEMRFLNDMRVTQISIEIDKDRTTAHRRLEKAISLVKMEEV